MSRLHVAFQEGFEDDAVEIWVDGERVYDKDPVRTRLQIGLADATDLDFDRSRVSVEVKVPGRGLSHKQDIDLSKPVYLAVSIDRSGRLEHRISDEPFGYL